MPKTNYKHLLEPIRTKIAVEYLQHEMRKIFPRIRDVKIWQKLDKEIKNLTNNPTMAPVRNFWNFVDAICLGLKLKNLVPRLTSANMRWSKEKVKVDNLYMGAKKDFKCLEKIDNNMPSGKEVREFLFDDKNKKILEFAKKDSLLNSKRTFDRDKHLIIVGEQAGKIIVYDGNRRLIKYILEDKQEVSAYMARIVKTRVLQLLGANFQNIKFSQPCQAIFKL